MSLQKGKQRQNHVNQGQHYVESISEVFNNPIPYIDKLNPVSKMVHIIPTFYALCNALLYVIALFVPSTGLEGDKIRVAARSNTWLSVL